VSLPYSTITQPAPLALFRQGLRTIFELVPLILGQVFLPQHLQLLLDAFALGALRRHLLSILLLLDSAAATVLVPLPLLQQQQQ